MKLIKLKTYPLIALTWSRAVSVANAFGANVARRSRPLPLSKHQLHHSSIADPFSRVINSHKAVAVDDVENESSKTSLLNLLSKVPPNESTPRELTRDILRAVRVLEEDCPTPEEDVLPSLVGNWELLWTAQDLSSLPKNNDGRARNNPFSTFINPLENQAYSNNPSGRSNPILPQNVQDGLEDLGLLSERKDVRNTIRSTQAIDLKKNRIRNVVSFEANNLTPLFSKGGKTRGLITVDVSGAANLDDKRRIDVKFDRCRVTLLDSPIDIAFPLGVVGPTGWLRTMYVDDDIRVTRGHKGSDSYFLELQDDIAT
eukprot:CAMPEP_0172554368 /NCGR_PEP_ID=MMETSP1067-20121228/54224_1 /TAXON_ID=265564 ORGANISM="Thalassiosira punctigera, Strain Tpunct2005C2" /NCGR_SAMPLE_ID=MMETSP1067 /ASSEMBLY_ACC=CAM_ASM_000444 /LENGTH=313 /DNA_ID=CAMNT_0013342721 /DNA_START=169 /DNA_END=1111 /DNA_ORIENTATION=+